MYNPTQWQDHVRTPANRFWLHLNDDGTYTITPAGEVMMEGTAQDQTHFNNMECGILDAHAALGLLINFFRQLDWKDADKFDNIDEAIAALDTALGNYEEQTDTTLADIRNALLLVLNYARQNKWSIDDIKKWIENHDTVESGTTTLTNTLKFPFNNSKKSVSLNKARETTNYIVLTEVTAFTGNVGDIEVSGKLVNGFQIAHTGSASSVTVKYVVLGGFEA